MPVSTPLPEQKSEVVQVRVTPRVKQLIRDAAEFSGRNISDFVVAAAEEKALNLFNDFAGYERIVLKGQDAIAFAEAILDDNDEPNERLRRSYEKYRDLLRSWEGQTTRDADR